MMCQEANKLLSLLKASFNANSIWMIS